MTVSELSQYAVSQVAMNAMPPDAAFGARAGSTTGGPAWRPPRRGCSAGFGTRRDGPYWRQGSLAPDYDAIEAAILNVGGWWTRTSMPRSGCRRDAPPRPGRSSGNWVHGWPRLGPPGPNLDELHEVVRFFDRWLKGEANGADDEAAASPGSNATSRRPGGVPGDWPGRWRAASAFPHPSTRETSLAFAGGASPLVGRLVARADRPGGRRRPVSAPRDGRDPRVAVLGRRRIRRTAWPATSGPMRASARRYTSDRSMSRCPSWGCRVVVLHVAVDVPVATAVVRLADVAPDGTSSRVSGGILNLTHRRLARDARAARARPGRGGPVPLRHAGYRFGAGHRIRVSVASRAWPVIWPSPYPATFELHRDEAPASHLVLPVIPEAGGAGDVPAPGVQDHASRCPRGRWRGRDRGRPPLVDRGGRHRRHDHGHDP